MRYVTPIALLAAVFCGIGRPAAGDPLPAPPARGASDERTILFIGNSFTFAAPGEVWRYRADTVTDLNGHGVGGIPALFKRFAEQTGLSYRVAVEAEGGKTLGFHYEQRRDQFDARWDHIVMQEFSTLDPDHPGDPGRFAAATARLTALFRSRNPRSDIRLVATWSRPDLVYRDPSPWHGRPIGAMAADLDRSYRAVAARVPGVRAVVPVGLAFDRAITEGIADADPFDGISPGTIDLWAPDSYHGSRYGYYLEALMVFGSVTGLNPEQLGAGERAASDLRIAPATAAALQRVAARELRLTPAR